MNGFKAIVQKILSRLGLVLLSANSFQELQGRAKLSRKFRFIEAFPPGEHLSDFLNYANQNFSQLDQDLLAILVSNFKQNGFFVEFGATNGKELSNSLLLETHLGWRGILAEPGLAWRQELAENRTAHISHDAVWNQTGVELDFIEDAELSTLAAFKNSDQHKRRGRNYKVSTITLMDLLKQYDAPGHIDFLSVDTEGSELAVLEAFDFTQYSFGLICVEHNFTENRIRIQTLLDANGYSRILSDASEWDDWFVPKK